jgi:hypothetical protein
VTRRAPSVLWHSITCWPSEAAARLEFRPPYVSEASSVRIPPPRRTKWTCTDRRRYLNVSSESAHSDNHDNFDKPPFSRRRKTPRLPQYRVSLFAVSARILMYLRPMPCTYLASPASESPLSVLGQLNVLSTPRALGPSMVDH